MNGNTNQISHKLREQEMSDIDAYMQNEVKSDTLHEDSKIYKVVNNYANIMQAMSIKSLRDVLKTFNPSSLYKKTYIQLDSRNAAYFDGNKTIWYLTKTQNIQQGFINVKCNMRDIVQIRLMNCYVYTNLMYVNTWSSNADLSSRRLALYIEEFGNQAFTLNTGIKFHFLGFTTRVIPTPATPPVYNVFDQIYYTNTEDHFNNGRFQFAKPVSLFDKITLLLSDLKLNMPLNARTIDITNNTIISVVLATTLRIVCLVSDNSYPVSIQSYLKNATTPDITTADPIADAAWITAMRAGSWFIYYSYQAITIYTTMTSAPTTDIQPFTIRFTVDLKLMTEFEITYLDTNI